MKNMFLFILLLFFSCENVNSAGQLFSIENETSKEIEIIKFEDGFYKENLPILIQENSTKEFENDCFFEEYEFEFSYNNETFSLKTNYVQDSKKVKIKFYEENSELKCILENNNRILVLEKKQ